MALKIAELVYGADFEFSAGPGSRRLTGFTAGCRILANQFLPYAQFQLGYTFTRKIYDRQSIHAVHLGFFAGVQ